MPRSDAAINGMLDNQATRDTHMSLHSAYDVAGGNELTGGSPAYARQPLAWGAASAGSNAITGTEQFDVPAGEEVQYIGLWDALVAGNFQGMFPAGALERLQFLGRDTGDLLVSDAHGYANDDRVAFFAVEGEPLPTGITAGLIYHVISASANDFQISLSQGGAAVVLTADGQGHMHKCSPELFGAQGTYTVSAFSATGKE